MQPRLHRPRIKRTTEVIEIPDGLFLLRPSLEESIRIEDPNERDLRLLNSLDGQHTLEQLHEEFGGEGTEELQQLQAHGVLEDASDDDRVPAEDLARFDRQLRYFSDAGGDLPPSECQRRLREATVAILGVGGLGGSAAIWLACCGIGEMWLVDGDRVETSNFNRQVLYDHDDIGSPKVKIAAQRLRSFYPALQITAFEERLEGQQGVSRFITGADLVVMAADWPAHEIEHWCNAACFEARVPYISMSHLPPYARVGPLYVPGQTGCYRCRENALREKYASFDEVIEGRRGKASPAATLGPACGLVGSIVALEVMHFLTGIAEPSTLGSEQIHDLRTMEMTREAVIAEPGCPVCGALQKGTYEPRTPRR